MAEESLFAGESKNIEYKVVVPKKSEKYMKTVVAFANGNGGKIVFGIDDKTLEIVGMDEDNIFKTMDAITNAISDSCEPRIRPDVTLQTVNDKTVIVVEILPGAMRPYYIKSEGMTEGTYMRVSGTTRPVEGYMLKELILEGQNRYFDSEPCRELQITDEDIQNHIHAVPKSGFPPDNSSSNSQNPMDAVFPEYKNPSAKSPFSPQPEQNRRQQK